MSHQYQPTSYYDWPARTHGVNLNAGLYQYIPYDYFAGDELLIRNTVFRDSEYVTYDHTHVRFLNRSDIHVYDTSSIKIFDSGTLTMYTSATTGTLPGSARKFVVDEWGRVGIGMYHLGPHNNVGESPSFDLDVKGQVGVEDYIYHNDDVDTYMLFGSDLSAHNVNITGDTNTILPTDWNEINFRVGGIDMIQMQTRDVDYPESGVIAVGTQDHITFNKYQTDVDFVVRSVTNTGAIVVSGDGHEVVINEDGNADTDFRIESDHEDHMFYLDTSVNRISIGDGGKDAPTATLEITNDPDSGAFDVPLVQLNSKDVDKEALDINADNTVADVVNVQANTITTGSLIHATTNGTDTSATSLVHFESTGDRGSNTVSTTLLDLNFDTTAGTKARTFKIDSEQTDSIVAEIDADRITTGTVLDISANDLNSGKGVNMLFGSRTTGTGLHIKDTHTSNSAGALVKIEQTGNRTGDAASIGVDINFDTVAAPNARTLRIDSEQTDGVVVEIDATEITSGKALAIDADKLTTGKGIELLMDTRTTGTGLHIHDDSTSDHAGALVKIEQEGARNGNAASIGVDLNFDTASNTAARAFRIDSEQTDGVVVEIDATPLTTGKGIHLHTTSRTTGTGLHIKDTNTSNSAGALVKIEQTGNRAGNAASIGVDINFDTVAAANARALRIDSEQTTGVVVEVDATPLTTGKGIHLHTDNRTTGTGLHIHDASTSNSAGALVLIEQVGNRAGAAASIGVDINFDTVAAANARALRIDSEQTTGTIVELDGDKLTSGTALDISNVDDLVNGCIVNLHSDSSSTTARNLVNIVNDNTAAVGTRLLSITNDAIASGVGESILFKSTAADTNPLLELRNTNTSTSSPAILNFNRSSTTEADDMGLGIIKFEGQNSGSEDITYAQLEVIASDVTNTDEGGKVTFKLQSGGIAGSAALNNLLSIGGEDVTNSTQCAVVVNEDSIDCDFRIESNTNTSAFWINGDGSEVVINDTGQNDTDFRVESNASDPNYTDQGVLHEAHKKTHALFVDTATGRVGLGVDSPQTTLHVAGSAHIEGDLWVKGVTNQIDTLVHVTSAMDITNSGTGPALKVTQTGNQPVASFYDDTFPALIIEDGDSSGPGNVGIGIANPVADLHLSKAAEIAEDNIFRITSLKSTHDPVIQMYGQDDSDIEGLEIWYDNSVGNAHISTLFKHATNSCLVFHTSAGGSKTAASERMRIDAKGRVGIGKSDPDCDLYIKGYAGNYDHTQTALRLITTTSTGNTATAEIGQNDRGGQLVYDTTYDKFSIYTHHNDEVQTNGNDPEGNPRGSGGIHMRHNRGWVGIGYKRPMTSLYIDDTDGIRIPIGTTAQRPVTGETDTTPTVEELYGTVRYNTEYLTFEGFGPGDTWGSLGGVIDIDRDTFWTALNDISGSNNYPGDPDCLRAFVGHNDSGINVDGTGDDEYNTAEPSGVQVSQIGLTKAWYANGIAGDYKLGIGTTNPNRALHVAAPSNPAIEISQVDSDIAAGSSLGFVYFGGSEDSGANWDHGAAIGAYAAEDWTVDSAAGADLTFWTIANTTSNAVERMRILDNGNVGIGTSSPGTKLEVAGSNPSIKVKADADGEDSHLMLHDHEGNGWTIYNEGANTDGAGVDSLLFRDDTNNVNSNGSGSVTSRAAIDVEIGTSEPFREPNRSPANGPAPAEVLVVESFGHDTSPQMLVFYHLVSVRDVNRSHCRYCSIRQQTRTTTPVPMTITVRL